MMLVGNMGESLFKAVTVSHQKAYLSRGFRIRLSVLSAREERHRALKESFVLPTEINVVPLRAVLSGFSLIPCPLL